MNPIKWDKYPIFYPSFKVCVIGDTKTGIIEFLKKIMPDKTKLIDTKELDTLNEFKNHLSRSYPSYLLKEPLEGSSDFSKKSLLKNQNNIHNTVFNYPELKKEEKFVIYYTDKSPPKYILTNCDMIFFDGNTSTSLLKEYLSTNFNQYAENTVISDIYFIVDKREKKHKVCYISKNSLQRYL